MKVTAKQLADLLQGVVEGNQEVMVHRPARIEEGEPGTLTFLANPKYEQYLYETEASVVLVPKAFQPKEPVRATLIRVDDVYQAMATLVEHYDPRPRHATGISESAMVSESAQIGVDVFIGEYVVIEDDVTVGDGTHILSHVFLGRGSKIGKGCIIHAGVKIYHECMLGDRVMVHANSVIGSDGFGFVKDIDGSFRKIKQIGNVKIGDDVEIGSNVVIDRASLGSTFIKNGVKLDNLIQIAHNVEVGENTAIAAQTGIAGSTSIGPDCLIGGQVGIVGHVSIGQGSEIQAQSGIASNIEPKSRLYGSPALDYGQFLRSYAAFKNLPNLVRQIHRLENRVEALEKTLRQNSSKA
ncbi:MAG: UDP-3-O-(3-hydroxymyristoyl)glucosamine N-acyltransferase [Saprospiraceae bacterium]|nr:UDP-3-O-(3-hydroxymyristoyl)glucosamine N-acyltransferase [Saprospiraceae bacterium]